MDFHPLFTYPRLYPLKILFTYENKNDIITCQWYNEYKISTVLETSGKYFFNVFFLKFFFVHEGMGFTWIWIMSKLDNFILDLVNNCVKNYIHIISICYKNITSLTKIIDWVKVFLILIKVLLIFIYIWWYLYNLFIIFFNNSCSPILVILHYQLLIVMLYKLTTINNQTSLSH